MEVQQILGFVLILALLAPAGAWAYEPQPPTECPAASGLISDLANIESTSISPSTIADLVSLSAPPEGESMEPTLWTFDGTVQRFQLLTDNNVVQAIVGDPSEPSLTVLVSFPDSACLSSDPMLAQHSQAARDTLLIACGSPTSVPQPCGARAHMTGLGGFSNSQIARAQPGAAPNGFELRAVFTFVAGSGAAAAPAVAPVVNGAGLTLSGGGAQDTAPFVLEPGPYTLRWTATAQTSETVNFAGFLKPVDPSLPEWIFVANAIVPAGQTQGGTVDVASAQAGAYYLTAIGASNWTVVITRAASRSPSPVGGVSHPTPTRTFRADNQLLVGNPTGPPRADNRPQVAIPTVLPRVENPRLAAIPTVPPRAHNRPLVTIPTVLPRVQNPAQVANSGVVRTPGPRPGSRVRIPRPTRALP